MKRNDFLKKAIAGTAALFAVKLGALAEIRDYKDPDKPLLTEASLNRFFSNLQLRRSDGSLEEIINDPKASLEKRFSISPLQKRFLDRLTPQDWESLSSIYRDARDKKGKLRFVNLSANKANGCKTDVRLIKETVQNKTIKEIVIKNHILK